MSELDRLINLEIRFMIDDDCDIEKVIISIKEILKSQGIKVLKFADTRDNLLSHKSVI